MFRPAPAIFRVVFGGTQTVGVVCWVGNYVGGVWMLCVYEFLSHTVRTGEPRQSWIAHQTDNAATNRAHFHINFTSWIFTEYLALLFDFNHTVF
jgi:hypothetical protein